MGKSKQLKLMNYINYADNGVLTIEKAAMPQPKSHEVLIKVAALGVNRADLLQKQGKYPPPEHDSLILGLEAAGIVVECAAPLQSQWFNKRVFGLTQGGAYAEYVCIDAQQLMLIPDEVSFEAAASFAEVYLTAFDAIVRTGQLCADDVLLVHGGASGVGSAAIRLGKALGAYVIATQSSEIKCQYAKQLGADLVINYNEHCFSQVMKSCGLYANVIIDPISGEYVDKNIKVAAMDCHCIVLAMLGGRYSELDMAKVLSKRVHLHGSTLRNRALEYKRQLVADFISRFGTQLFTETMRIPIHKSFAFSEIEQAHAMLHNNENMGKVIVSIS
ncbi:L-threonine 3-dehydrogenase [Pseudoalteromonas sp. CIP111854]|uniref:L-threonine 3-dehydrogenase n=1 Tax=Pseudoalteromonas holothuriae TaxID=2963714 RepID=A0A9W4VZM2_9GAMM|nr:NAD(P)H-quinone oxidoreductase [Pseudoalteromonas sp. CIP111854]CAH9058374.1 L-threonine 3-dehydrogenase [Pseudoalteromonas sp. CIP111854]